MSTPTDEVPARTIAEEEAHLAEELLASQPFTQQRGLRGLLGELWQDKAGFFGAVFLAVLLLAAVFAPLVAPYDPAAQSLSDRLQPPAWGDGGSWSHPLGTDNLGRDVLSRVIFGSRISL